jgi:hypothetical protein
VEIVAKDLFLVNPLGLIMPTPYLMVIYREGIGIARGVEVRQSKREEVKQNVK